MPQRSLRCHIRSRTLRALTSIGQIIEDRKCAETAKVSSNTRIAYNYSYGNLAREVGRFPETGNYTTIQIKDLAQPHPLGFVVSGPLTDLLQTAARGFGPSGARWRRQKRRTRRSGQAGAGASKELIVFPGPDPDRAPVAALRRPFQPHSLAPARARAHWSRLGSCRGRRPRQRGPKALSEGTARNQRGPFSPVLKGPMPRQGLASRANRSAVAAFCGKSLRRGFPRTP